MKQSKNIIINKTTTTTTTKKNILFFKLYKGSKKADSPIIWYNLRYTFNVIAIWKKNEFMLKRKYILP